MRTFAVGLELLPFSRGLAVKRKQNKLDAAYPTVVRYVGILLVAVIVVATLFGHGEDVASLGVLALGMILYKTVKGAAENDH